MHAWIEFAAFALVITSLTPLLGGYMAAVFEGPPRGVRRLLGGIESSVYRMCRIDPAREMRWTDYLWAVVAFSAVSAAALFALLLFQAALPLDAQHFAGLSPLLALNVAVSFATTTNWQAYSGESALGYLAQMAGLAWQNFVAAAVGLAVAIAMIRGFTRSAGSTIGNFWVDLTRSLLYVLLPLSIAGALLFVWQGTPQNFAPYVTATTLDGAPQTIPSGPIASQEIIKQLGLNGGGFVAANSAAPSENPTPLTDLLQLVAMFVLGNAKTAGTLSTATPLFGALLGATALVVTALTFVPADALGPIAEALR